MEEPFFFTEMWKNPTNEKNKKNEPLNYNEKRKKGSVSNGKSLIMKQEKKITFNDSS